jgi:ribosomal protein S18 acetylase RimI-like enzyme
VREFASVQVRERRAEDLDQLAVVAHRVRTSDRYPICLPDGNLLRFLTHPESFGAWVASQDQAVVGHVALNTETSRPVMRLARHVVNGSPAFVARLFVDPDARRRGIGARLLDHARVSAVTRGYVPVLDVVDTPSATAAISLYRRSGWQEVGRTVFRLADETEADELIFVWPHG